MKSTVSFILLALLMWISSCSRMTTQPLSLHPDNPHYFLFRGEPVVLIGSTEHYGAVLNLDFDYTVYFDELAAHGLNLTRTFSGAYVEPTGAFGIEHNTLAPEPGKFICPWARSTEPGYAGGGNRFDLEKWDEAYFARMKDFIGQAGQRGIVVEVNLFSNYYDTLQWKLSPLYHANNINGIGQTEGHKEVLSLKHADLLDVQEKLAIKMLTELQEFDNIYFEICNEPYFGDLEALESWEKHMTDVLAEARKGLKYKHLISQNIANDFARVSSPHPAVSILNFHYAYPPVAVDMNYDLNLVVGDNETGFDGTSDFVYRREAWQFMLAGGGLYNHLDYSFTTNAEDGSHPVSKGQPGGGSDSLRAQLGILKSVLGELNLVQMAPDTLLIQGIHKERVSRALSDGTSVFLIYMSRDAAGARSCAMAPRLAPGSYRGEWIHTLTGERTPFEIADHPGGAKALITPVFSEDIALKLVKMQATGK